MGTEGILQDMRSLCVENHLFLTTFITFIKEMIFAIVLKS